VRPETFFVINSAKNGQAEEIENKGFMGALLRI